MRSAVLAVIGLAASAAAGMAAEPAESHVRVGSQMRVQSRTAEDPVKGTLVGIDEDALKLATIGWSRSFPVESIGKAEVRVGRRRRILEGLALGIAAGALVSQLWDVDPDHCGGDTGTHCSRRAATLSGMAGYGVIGGSIGAAFKKDRWGVVDVRAAIAQARGAGLDAPVPSAPSGPLGRELAPDACSRIEAADHVRLTAPGVFDDRVTGYALGSDAETLQIVYSGQTMRVPRKSVTRLERSTRRSQRMRGLKVGAVVGAVGATVASVLLLDEDEDAPHGTTLLHAFAGYMGAFPGAALGWALAPGERWKGEDPSRVCVPRVTSAQPQRRARLRAGIAPVPGGGVGVKVSVGF